MIKELRLRNFKNFQDATLRLGPFTVLVGANASGKSNIREALRFLHGMARGYSVAETIGRKFGEGGDLQWAGIRGGLREIAYRRSGAFELEASFATHQEGRLYTGQYEVAVDVGTGHRSPRMLRERFGVEGIGDFRFEAHPGGDHPPAQDLLHLTIYVDDPEHGHVKFSFLNPHSVLPILLDADTLGRMSEFQRDLMRPARQAARITLSVLRSMRFLELDPDALREPSLPGQTVLSDRGANLASVLQAACEDDRRRAAVVSWLQQLTPTDVADLKFPSDVAGRLLLNLVERDGHRTSSFSASDGTLRFLGVLAALLGPDPARFYFVEELENGIHPARLHLLTGLIEQMTREDAIQFVATSHSSQLLQVLRGESLQYASVVYCLPEHPEGRITPVLDVPTVPEVLENQALMDLHGSGWLEHNLWFAEPDEDGTPAATRKRRPRRKPARRAAKEQAA